MKVVTSKKCWSYGQEGHPESPARVRETYKLLESLGFSFIEPAECGKKDILRAHTKRLLDEVESGDFYESDTPAYTGIYGYAALSAGAAIAAMEICLPPECFRGTAQRCWTAPSETAKSLNGPRREPAFSLMRPPGHHAGRDSLGGFCYFNNIAVAIKKALASGVLKAAILDIDCHHGNGTQDIFLGDRKVIYCSLHQSPLYPGTGLVSEKNCLNFPLPPHTGEEVYFKTLASAISAIKEFGPELLGVSAGFDTYEGDPIAQLSLKKETYGKIGKMIAGMGLPVFAVLEGGYSDDLPECIYNFLSAF
jgi:acetoin utilization deacetylase AcuC-like enzyme